MVPSSLLCMDWISLMVSLVTFRRLYYHKQCPCWASWNRYFLSSRSGGICFLQIDWSGYFKPSCTRRKIRSKLSLVVCIHIYIYINTHCLHIYIYIYICVWYIHIYIYIYVLYVYIVIYHIYPFLALVEWGAFGQQVWCTLRFLCCLGQTLVSHRARWSI